MIYTDEVRKKLDAILKAFGEYIDGQSYFDIVYSKKIGYVWILAECPGDAGAVLLDTPEKMLDPPFVFYSLLADTSNKSIHFCNSKFVRLPDISVVFLIQILLQGKWLEQAGFSAGDKITVKCQEGQLTITKDGTRKDSEE